MPSLNQEILRNVVIPFPPTRTEQQAIAEALSDADALIESLEQLRALENGYPLRVVESAFDSIEVDTAEDLKVVEAYLRQEGEGP